MSVICFDPSAPLAPARRDEDQGAECADSTPDDLES
jgi:hypothetical protein